MAQAPAITVLGGGIAGLAVGHFARRRGLSFTILEAGQEPGGNCRTLRSGDFLFDTGAHRLHDQDPSVTAEVRSLLNGNLAKVEAPSQIYLDGRYVRFPLSLINLAVSLGPRRLACVCAEVVGERLRLPAKLDNFEALSYHRYGKTLAGKFLLSYTEKLWGVPCRDLAPEVAGRRLKGLSMSIFLREAVLGMSAGNRHLEGAFYYPNRGIGEITSALAMSCGNGTVRLGCPVTRVVRRDRRIAAVEVNGSETLPVDRVVSTIPLRKLVESLHPTPPREILHLAAALRHRALVLVCLFLARERISSNATIYFPGREFPFTRVSEPKNRSLLMAPSGSTSLVAELPADQGDSIWNRADDQLVAEVAESFRRLGWIREGDIVGSAVMRLPDAYAVLTKEASRAVTSIAAYLREFGNLTIVGRNGSHVYSHIHDAINDGRVTVQSLLDTQAAPPQEEDLHR